MVNIGMWYLLSLSIHVDHLHLRSLVDFAPLSQLVVHALQIILYELQRFSQRVRTLTNLLNQSLQNNGIRHL
jgi:hypothetical protein